MRIFDFRNGAYDKPQLIDSGSGIMPNKAPQSNDNKGAEARIGLFADMMPQSIITCAVAYRLTEIRLMGHESDTLVRNLRATMVPDICPNLTIVKYPIDNN